MNFDNNSNINKSGESAAKAEKSLFIRTPVIIGIVFVIACIIVSLPLIVFPNKSLGTFKSELSAGNYEAAMRLYYDTGSEGNLRARMESYIIQSTDLKFTQYKNGNTDFEALEEYMNNITQSFKLNGFAVYNAMLEELRTSYSNYCTGAELESENKLGDAIISYMEVAENDPKYLSVKSKITELKDTYKKQLEDELSEYNQSGNYSSALEALDIAEKIFGEGSYAAKREQFEAIKNEHEKITARDSQAVYSYDAHVSLKGNGSDDLLVANVKNNSNNVVKMYIVAFCAYDKDGKLVSLSSKSTPGELTDYVRCQNKSISLKPGHNTGSSFGWAIGDGIADNIYRLDSCIISAEYEDGTVWNNPYYKYWCSDNGIVDLQGIT